MSGRESEAELLQNITANLEAEGYTVYINPDLHILPPFMRQYRPDAIALGKPKNLAIEIVDPSSEAKKVDALRELLSTSKDWELRVHYILRAETGTYFIRAPKPTTDAALQLTEKLLNEGEFQPALLMAWACFEAIGRSLMPDQFARPQTPGRLIEVLAREGKLTPTEADSLRVLALKRNHLIHGGLDVAASLGELQSFVAILRNLIR